MKKTLFYLFAVSLLSANSGWAQTPAATAKPEEISMEALLSANQPAPGEKAATKSRKKAAKKQAAANKKVAKAAVNDATEQEAGNLAAPVAPEAQPIEEETKVANEAVDASVQSEASSAEEVVVATGEQAAQPASPMTEEEKVLQEEPVKPDFVAPRETVPEQPVVEKKPKVVYNPTNHRDPTLSPDDFLLLQHREQQRLAAIEAERQRKLEEERRAKEEAERQRLLELARIKDPTREVRNKIKVGGIIGQEVFIGSKIYTVGKSIYGARIVEVRPEEVVFSYKGHKFVRKVQLN